jgi:hypothetical protein
MATELTVTLNEQQAAEALQRLSSQVLKADATLDQMAKRLVVNEQAFDRQRQVVDRVISVLGQLGGAAEDSAGRFAEGISQTTTAAEDMARSVQKSMAEVHKALTGVVRKETFHDQIEEVLGLNRALDDTEKRLHKIASGYRDVAVAARMAQTAGNLGGVSGSFGVYSGGPGMRGLPVAGGGWGSFAGNIAGAAALRYSPVGALASGVAGSLDANATLNLDQANMPLADMRAQMLAANTNRDREAYGGMSAWNPLRWGAEAFNWVGRQGRRDATLTRDFTEQFERASGFGKLGVLARATPTLAVTGLARGASNLLGVGGEAPAEETDAFAFQQAEERRRFQRAQLAEVNRQSQVQGAGNAAAFGSRTQIEVETINRRDRLLSIEKRITDELKKADELAKAGNLKYDDAIRFQMQIAELTQKQVESKRNEFQWEDQQAAFKRQLFNEERARYVTLQQAEHDLLEIERQKQALTANGRANLTGPQLAELEERKAIAQARVAEAQRERLDVGDRMLKLSHQQLVDARAWLGTEEDASRVLRENAELMARGNLNVQQRLRINLENAAAEQRLNESLAIRVQLLDQAKMRAVQGGVAARLMNSTEAEAAEVQRGGVNRMTLRGANRFDEQAGLAAVQAARGRRDELAGQRVGSIAGIEEGLRDRQTDFQIRVADDAGRQALDRYGAQIREFQQRLKEEQRASDEEWANAELDLIKRVSAAERERARENKTLSAEQRAEKLKSIDIAEKAATAEIEAERKKERVYRDAHQERLRQIRELEARLDEQVNRELKRIDDLKQAIGGLVGAGRGGNPLANLFGARGGDGAAMHGGWGGGFHGGGFGGGFHPGGFHGGGGAGIMNLGPIAGMGMPIQWQGFRSPWRPEAWAPNATPPGFERVNAPFWATNGAEIQRPGNMFGGGDGVVTARGGHRGGIYGGVLGGMGLGRAITGGPMTGGPFTPEGLLGFGFGGQEIIDNTTMRGGGGRGGMSAIDRSAVERIAQARAAAAIREDQRLGEFQVDRFGRPRTDARGNKIRRRQRTPKEHLKRARSQAWRDAQMGRLSPDEIARGRREAARGAAGFNPDRGGILDRMNPDLAEIIRQQREGGAPGKGALGLRDFQRQFGADRRAAAEFGDNRADLDRQPGQGKRGGRPFDDAFLKLLQKQLKDLELDTEAQEKNAELLKTLKEQLDGLLGRREALRNQNVWNE